MRNISFRAHILPHLVAIVVFLVVTILFFSPLFFSSRTLDQYDINQWKGGAQEIIEYREATGEEPLWTNSMFSGMPAYLVDVKWNDGIITNLKIIAAAGLPHPVRNIFLAFLSFYILLLVFKVRPYLAIGGALVFGLSTYLIIGIAAGHNARIGAIAFMPLVMAGIHLTYSSNRWLGASLTAVAVALQLRENHLQITYYLLFIVAVYAIIQLISSLKTDGMRDFLIRSALLLAAALIAFGTFFGKFQTITNYSQYTMRGTSELKADIEQGENESGLKKGYAFEYSYGLMEPMTLFIPQYYGGTSANLLVQDEESAVLTALQTAPDPQLANQLARYTSAYWGPQSYSTPYYIGAVAIMLFVIGLFFADRRSRVWLVVVSVLGILLSYGDNLAWFNYMMFDYFPGYNKFRSVTFAIILPVFSIPLLGMIGLERLLAQPVNPQIRKKLLIALAIPAGLCVLVLLFSGMNDFMREGEEQLPQWFLRALTDDRAGLLREDALRSLFFVILSGGLVYFAWIGKLSKTVFTAAIVVLMLVDMWTVNIRYFGEDNYRRISDRSFFTATDADKLILQDDTPGYRVLNLQNPFAEARTSYFHQSIGGYHGAKIRRYQDLIDYCIQSEIQNLIQGFQSGSTDLSSFGVLNMLNTKYLVYGPDRENVIPNPSANGAAWFVDEVIIVEGADAEVQRTCEINSREQAVIDVQKFDWSNASLSQGEITVESYKPNDITYRTDNPGEGLAVFSEIYYEDGWIVTIDGEEAEMLRANYVLRALRVPAGSHTIRFEFRPSVYATGNTIMLISSILMVLVFAGAVVYSYRQWRNQPEVAA